MKVESMTNWLGKRKLSVLLSAIAIFGLMAAWWCYPVDQLQLPDQFHDLDGAWQAASRE